ncbi:PqqD family protein [Enterococcus sp. BWT-B8]|uniref:PqqD family protein n=1 Tax=Enterococcus sp. BWT-B8 TaxID=2885157 RepID=UPI001E2ED94C|nr:PqqD family protein [Enterococcus sp. BWT-B8]MCB5953040.1 PqqD family protein [Enterococcus sp. BWT-B8]
MNTLIEFLPKIVENFFVYRRSEPDGGETIKVGSATFPTKLINKQFTEILNLCNGETSILEMIEIQSVRYPSISRETIQADVIHVVQILTEMGALSNNPNPFFQKIELLTQDNCLVVNSPYSHYLQLRKFIEKIEAIEHYKNPSSSTSLLSSLSIGRCFPDSIKGYYFHILKDEQLVGVIIWGSMIPTIYTLEYVSFLENFEYSIESCITTSVKLLDNLMETKNHYSMQFDNSKQFESFYNLFKNKNTTILSQELEDHRDILEVSLL